MPFRHISRRIMFNLKQKLPRTVAFGSRFHRVAMSSAAKSTDTGRQGEPLLLEGTSPESAPSDVTKLEVGAPKQQSMKLDALGPMVVNRDGVSSSSHFVYLEMWQLDRQCTDVRLRTCRLCLGSQIGQV